MHMEMAVVKKALAYITRYREGEWQLLVHQHRDHPEAGVQVPGGGVEPNEDEKEAVVREVFEESGLKNIEYVRRVGVYEYFATHKQEHQLRFVYHFKEKREARIPDHWDHVVTSDGEDDGLVFQYFWIPIDELVGDRCDRRGNVFRVEHLPDLVRLEKESGIC